MKNDKMNEPTNLYYYTIFGLNISSECELDMLNLITQPTSIDVTIAFGKTPTQLDNPLDKNASFEAKEGAFLTWFTDISLRFYVENGTKIIIETGGSEDWDLIKSFLLSAIMGALLHQRKVIPLHAGGVVINGEVILFSGQSGAGKSTTTAAFKEQGYQLMADDVAVIHYDEEKIPIVEPGVPFVKLWKESFDILEKKVPTKGKIRKNFDKYFVPIKNLAVAALPIKRIYILEKSDQITEPIIKDLSNIETVHHLRMGTYRYYYLIGMKGEKEHFQLAFDLGNQKKVKHLTRPMKYPVNELLSFILDDLEQNK